MTGERCKREGKVPEDWKKDCQNFVLVNAGEKVLYLNMKIGEKKKIYNSDHNEMPKKL